MSRQIRSNSAHPALGAQDKYGIGWRKALSRIAPRRVAARGFWAYNFRWLCLRRLLAPSAAETRFRPPMYFLYSVMFSLGIIVTAPYYLWRLRGKILSGAGWRERLGYLPADFPAPADPGAIWVHAVSVGETLAVAGLIRELQSRYPGRRIFLSHVTPAGREASEKRQPGVEGRFYLPLDWRFSTRRVVERLRPALLVIAETELWPNLLRAAHEGGARVALVNARLSDRSFRGYRRIRPFMRRVLAHVDWIGAQSPADRERFLALGAPVERVSVTGNIKFDAQPPVAKEFTAALGQALELAARAPVVVAASTMAGEETPVLAAWRRVRAAHSRALLILAPRHPARFDSVAQILARQGHAALRRTALESSPQGMARQLAAAEILLLDTIGELAGIFELGDAVFVGGSFVPTGGHNLLEPAYWGKAILFGPHMYNFRDIAARFLEAGAAVQVESDEALGQALLDLLADEPRRHQLGTAARRLLEIESGATARILGHLQEWLEAGVEAPRTFGAVPGSEAR
jgi:3-deoxy-D-manno-octulosonic-acid transferase